MDTKYVGFDLGTTNSACAVFDGERVTVVRSAQGGHLTPSVVRLSNKGVVSVGQKARRYLERDPSNTRSEFKRLMGTKQRLNFPACGQDCSPEQLASEILKVLCSDVEQQLGFRPTKAIVTVPALFELPQSNATAEAARLAGLDQVELLQEPVASALAAGWGQDNAHSSWLVFDLGGGTFDVSLLEAREGLLRVVGHDGDNFLGGRDFDRVIVDWAINEIAREQQVSIRRDNPDHQDALFQLTLAAEEAKIELSTQDSVSLGTATELDVDGDLVEVDLTLDRTTFESLVKPLIDRAISICERLLAEHGLTKEQLQRIVMVGGPSMMPLLRQEVGGRLAPLASEELDPMTLVAQGAALYAATAGLNAVPEDATAVSQAAACPNKFWLQHPPMCSDLEPFVMGRLVERGNPAPVKVQLVNSLSQWRSETVDLDDEGTFVVSAVLEARRTNPLKLLAYDAQGKEVPVTPGEFLIVHGLAISDPPLSRTIGVALADGRVRTFFDRGTPLPAKRTFVQKTIETLICGPRGTSIRIPIVQGEYEEAHLCRLVGSLEIDGRELDVSLVTGTEVEITLELDRGGNLKATALIPHINKMFFGVAHLIVPNADLAVLQQELGTLRGRLGTLQGRAFREGDSAAIERYGRWHLVLEESARDLDMLAGGSEDAGQRARRNLTEVEALIEKNESEARMEELLEEGESAVYSAHHWLSEFGTETERNLFKTAYESMRQSVAQRRLAEYHRQLSRIRQLASDAFKRSPDAWSWYFNEAASRVHEANNLKAAQALVERGRKCLKEPNDTELRAIVRELWELLPADLREKQKSFDSGIR